MGDRIQTRDLARGRWTEILQTLGIPAKALNGRNQPCLFCGGRDRARYTNYRDEGGYLCNQCGFRNGFKLLMDFHKWTFKQAATEIDKLLTNNYRVSMSSTNRPSDQEIKIPKSVRDCALWLRKNRPAELEQWLDRHEPEVRWWLERERV